MCSNVTTVTANSGRYLDTVAEIGYYDVRPIGKGSYGEVVSARLESSGEKVAIKRVPDSTNSYQKELFFLRMFDHVNVVPVDWFFRERSSDGRVHLNMVLQYFPQDLQAAINGSLPISSVRLYGYQMFRAIAYVHSMGVCHRDIKPTNLLINSRFGALKLCDFGLSEKPGDQTGVVAGNMAYFAPELLYGTTQYDFSVDVWAAGCVMHDMMRNKPIFDGTGQDGGCTFKAQRDAIANVLGSPSCQVLLQYNPGNGIFMDTCPRAPCMTLESVFSCVDAPPELGYLLRAIFQYEPKKRLHPLAACAHTFFDELRHPDTRLASGNPLPPLFNFSPKELRTCPALQATLLPYPVAGRRGKVAMRSGRNADAGSSLCC